MIQSNIDFLEANRDCYNEVVNAQTATKANKIKGELYRILKQEFLPGYVYRDDCGSCLFDMVNILYRKFDDWKASQPVVNAEIPPMIFDDTKEGPTDPVPIESIKATFPYHQPVEEVNEVTIIKEGKVELPQEPKEIIEWHNEMANKTLKPDPPIKNDKNHRRK